MPTHFSNEQKLHEFLFDIKNIKYYMCNYESLQNFYSECMLILKNKNFLPTHKDKYGNNFLHIALSNQAFDEAKLLLKAGVNLNELNNKNQTPLMCLKNSDYTFTSTKQQS